MLMMFSGSAFPQTSSVNGQIAYTVCESTSEPNLPNQCDIWVMEANGADQKNLTNTPDLNEMNPAWSPDGARIAFIEGYNFLNRLEVMNSDGTDRTIVTPQQADQFAPSWSPAGTQIAIVRLLPGEFITTQFDIVVVNADGSGEVNITHSDTDELDPAWSPDGSKIAFAGVRLEVMGTDLEGEPEPEFQWEIVTANPDGSEEMILSAGESDSTRALSLEEDRSPAWSPDSSQLVFASQSVDPCCDDWKILIVNSDGSGLTLLSENPLVNDFAPSFSPDGTMIVFTSDRDAVVGGEFDIYSIPVPGAFTPIQRMSAKRLTSSGAATEADWGRLQGSTPERRKYPMFVSLMSKGKAGGKIVSRPKGIKCGKNCSEDFVTGSEITLTAIAKKRFVFSGWSGACSIAGSQPVCTVNVDDAKVIGAFFTRVP
jgi:Tol biopolymer transport system component